MNKEKEYLNVDMDGVCADFDEAILAIDPSLGTLSSTAPNYEERSARVDEIVLANPHIFENLKPISGNLSLSLISEFLNLFRFLPPSKIPLPSLYFG